MPRRKKIVTNELKIPEGIGVSTDKYKWLQYHSDVHVYIKIPEGTKAKQMDIQITPNSLKVAIRGQQEPILQGELVNKVKVEDCWWEIEDPTTLLIILQKFTTRELAQHSMAETWWKAFLIGEPEIPLQYAPSEYFTDYK